MFKITIELQSLNGSAIEQILNLNYLVTSFSFKVFSRNESSTFEEIRFYWS